MSEVFDHLLQREKHIFSVGLRAATQNLGDISSNWFQYFAWKFIWNLISLFLEFIEYWSDPSKMKILSSLQKKIGKFNFEVHVGVDVLHRKLSNKAWELALAPLQKVKPT